MRRFGAIWLGCKLWVMAKLDEFFETHLPRGVEDIPWSMTAKILTVARLCEPSSELHIAEDWLRKTALADILGIDEEKINEDRLYRGLDKALLLKPALEAHVKKQWEGLFELKYDLLLYDITPRLSREMKVPAATCCFYAAVMNVARKSRLCRSCFRSESKKLWQNYSGVARKRPARCHWRKSSAKWGVC